MHIYKASKFCRNNRFVPTSLITDFGNNSFPRFTFFEDLTGKHFHNLSYKLYFLHTDLPMLHKRSCSSTIPPLLIYLECPHTQWISNIAHIRNKTCVTKYIKFVKVSSQVRIK